MIICWKSLVRWSLYIDSLLGSIAVASSYGQNTISCPPSFVRGLAEQGPRVYLFMVLGLAYFYCSLLAFFAIMHCFIIFCGRKSTLSLKFDRSCLQVLVEMIMIVNVAQGTMQPQHWLASYCVFFFHLLSFVMPDSFRLHHEAVHQVSQHQEWRVDSSELHSLGRQLGQRVLCRC